MYEEKEDSTKVQSSPRVKSSDFESRGAMKELMGKDEFLNEAYKKYGKTSWDREMQIVYTSYQKAVLDHNTIMEERYEEGYQIGRQKSRQELLNQLKIMGIEIPDEFFDNQK